MYDTNKKQQIGSIGHQFTQDTDSNLNIQEKFPYYRRKLNGKVLELFCQAEFFLNSDQTSFLSSSHLFTSALRFYSDTMTLWDHCEDSWIRTQHWCDINEPSYLPFLTNTVQSYFIWLSSTLCSPEASLVIPDFTISVYGSSCTYLFFGLILTPLLFLSIYLHPPRMDGMPRNK